MGQTRTDSNQQVAAKERCAERRRCPKCGRKSALQTFDHGIVSGVACRWCDYSRTFGGSDSR